MLLFGGQVLPFVLLGCLGLMGGLEVAITTTAVGLAYLPRLDAARRFRQSWLGAALHPVGVLVLLAIQWYAAARAIVGRPVGWKGRGRPSANANPPDAAPQRGPTARLADRRPA